MTVRKSTPGQQAAGDDLPTLLFKSPRDWERWLDAHHDTSRGLWLKIGKGDAAPGTITYAQALEIALLFGWIDGQKGKLDAAFWLQKFTPRGPKSRWSQVNRAAALRLMKEGRMRPSGVSAIESAKADGRWAAAYEPQSRASVPDDLKNALASNKAAQTFFDALDGRNRYAILYRVNDAKKPETRMKRIATYVQMLARGETLHPQTPSSPPRQPGAEPRAAPRVKREPNRRG
jgi:uncharacterized protein YdeI (YjbR/CyaY-like superfamily)